MKKQRKFPSPRMRHSWSAAQAKMVTLKVQNLPSDQRHTCLGSSLGLLTYNLVLQTPWQRLRPWLGDSATQRIHCSLYTHSEKSNNSPNTTYEGLGRGRNQKNLQGGVRLTWQLTWVGWWQRDLVVTHGLSPWKDLGLGLRRQESGVSEFEWGEGQLKILLHVSRVILNSVV